jgi:STAS-like domain of unknown function (DUF4325)
MITVKLASQFSRYPAGRYVVDGPFSGEAFRERFLVPNLKNEQEVLVQLDGARGYGSSFLEEAFGGLVRKGFDKEFLKSHLKVDASNTSLVYEIDQYINEAGSA